MSDFEYQDRDSRWDEDARRDRDHKHNHDLVRPRPPQPNPDYRGDYQDSKGKEPERRTPTEEHSQSSRTRDRRYYTSKKNKEPSSSSKASRSQTENDPYVESNDQPLTSNTIDNSGINWGSWRRLPNGQWRREGQNPSGSWYEEIRDEEPRVPRRLPPVREDISGINWGPWGRLPNGQWRREGQDPSGNWYEEHRDEDPRGGTRHTVAPNEAPRVPSHREVVEVAADTQSSKISPTLTHERRPKQPAIIVPLKKKKARTRWSSNASIFQRAISERDTKTVYGMLEKSFEDVATGEYSWLCELRKLGYSSREIGDELLEAFQDEPWIFSESEVLDSQPSSPGFHIKDCLHSNRIESNQTMERSIPPSRHTKSAVRNSNTPRQSVRENIEYLCGVGGVSPMPTGARETQFGFVKFQDCNSTAIVSFRSPSKRSESSLRDVLVHLTRAIGVLQRSGGCCDSFTFISRLMEQSFVELHRIDLLFVENLLHATEEQESQDSILTELASAFFSQIFGKADQEPLSLALQTQFLCLAFLSYSQAHCGPIRPFFLDTPLRRIILIGDNEWHENFQGPCIVGSLMNLSCFGDMLQEPIFTFRYHHGHGVTTPSNPDLRVDLFAEPEDVLDTWGPGELITPNDDPTKLHAISIGTGYIIPSPIQSESTSTKLHWCQKVKASTLTSYTFPRSGKAMVGTRISLNMSCNGEPLAQIKRADALVKYLGTFGTSWEVTERQFGFGIQGGATVVSVLQFGQTWTKRKAQTIKTTFLTQRPLNVLDLDALFAIQISVCTGIARRVRLRDLLAEILRTYATAPVARTPLCKSLYTKSGMIEALQDGDLADWYDKLEYELQIAFESLVFEVLSVLKDTGVDRNGERFIVGCIQPGMPFQCFHIPCQRENYWTRIVADSEDFATFAYMTTKCLETDTVKCRGSRASWVNSTRFLCTAVSFCDGENSIVNQARWTLRDSESYLIGRVDAPLIVDVERPNARDEPRLLVSLSKIRPEFLLRLNRKGKNGKPKRLQEKRMINQIAERVVVVANRR